MTVTEFPKPPKPKPAGKPEGIEVMPSPAQQLIMLMDGANRFIAASHRVQVLAPAMPALLKVTDGQVPGGLLAFRSGGDECLFAARDGRSLMWVPVGQLSIDPAAFEAPK